MKQPNRRNFIKLAGAGLAAGLAARNLPAMPDFFSTPPAGKHLFRLGVASYTLRRFSLEDALRMTARLGIDQITLKDMHLPLDSNPEQISGALRIAGEKGIQIYGAGVVYMKNEQEVHRAFEYARRAQMEVIIGVPEHPLLPLVNEKVKETGIRLAIHNHGPGDERYPSPESAYERIKGLDEKIGLCLDIGHTRRLGLDPAAEAEKYFDRLIDVHIKDVSADNAEGRTVEIGRGVINIRSFLSVLLKNKFSGRVSFEHEKDPDDPLAGLAESVGFVRGMLAAGII